MEEGQNQTEEEGIISISEIGQVLQSMRLEIEAPNYADITALIESGIEDILFKDEPTPDDIYIPSLFESSNVLNLKFNAMNSNFAYFCDISFNNDEHFIEPYMSIFDIHSINTKPFNLDMDENPRILYISKDVTLEEMRELEKILTKYSKVFAWMYDDMPGIDRDIA